MIPFSGEVLFAQLGEYNLAIWPAQLVAYMFGLLALGLAIKPTRAAPRIIGLILALLWAWNSIVYLWSTFSAISFYGPVLAGLALLQSLLMLWAVVVRGDAQLAVRHDVRSMSGLALCVVALTIYPLVSWAAAHGWPQMALFGVSPPATVIFTLGILLMIHHRTPVLLAFIPLLWTLKSTALAWYLGIPENALLLLAGLVVLFFLMKKTPDKP